MILEDDQPCAARIDAFDLALRLEWRGFAEGPGKRVLRFGGGSQETQDLALPLPPGAVELEGSLRVSLSGRPAGASAAAPEASAPAALADGVAVGDGRAVAGRLDHPAAAVVVDAVVVLAAGEPQAAVRALLQSDRKGWPHAVLADGGEVAPGGVAPARSRSPSRRRRFRRGRSG